MIFDEDPEVGAFLLVDWSVNKIQGYLYRVEEIKETIDQPVMEWSIPPGPGETEGSGDLVQVGTRKEEIVKRHDYYIMDIKGNWALSFEHTNPFLYMAGQILGNPKMCGDKNQMDWSILADWLGDLESNWNHNEYRQMPEGKDPTDADRIRWDEVRKSIDWIQTTLNNPPAGKVGTQHLLRELDKFEYNIGNK
jgi:hypothetical protein